MAQLESIRREAEAESAINSAGPADCVRTMTSLELESTADASAMAAMHLTGTAQGANDQIAQVLRDKAQVYSQFGAACAELLRRPAPGVDYGAISARMPRYTAQLEFLDRSLLQFSPMLFAALLDMRPDSLGHVSHLVITTEERRALIASIDAQFGPSAQASRGQNNIVSSVAVLRSYLANPGWKSADEPW